MSDSKGSGIGAQIAGNLASVGLQGIINRRAERRQWNRNVSMWKMQNEYNTPINQMKRLKEAGLNPNLMYGKGTVGNSTTLPQYNALPPQGMGEVFGKSIAGLQGLTQTDVLKTEIIKNDIKNVFDKQNNPKLLTQQDLNNNAIRANILLTKAQAASEGENYNYKKAQTSYVTAQSKNVDISNKKLAEQYKQEVKRTERMEFGLENATPGMKATFEAMKASNFTDAQMRTAIAGLQVTDRLIQIAVTVLGISKVTQLFGKKRVAKVVNNPEAAAAIQKINVQNQ